MYSRRWDLLTWPTEPVEVDCWELCVGLCLAGLKSCYRTTLMVSFRRRSPSYHRVFLTVVGVSHVRDFWRVARSAQCVWGTPVEKTRCIYVSLLPIHPQVCHSNNMSTHDQDLIHASSIQQIKRKGFAWKQLPRDLCKAPRRRTDRPSRCPEL